MGKGWVGSRQGEEEGERGGRLWQQTFDVLQGVEALADSL